MPQIWKHYGQNFTYFLKYYPDFMMMKQVCDWSHSFKQNETSCVWSLNPDHAAWFCLQKALNLPIAACSYIVFICIWIHQYNLLKHLTLNVLEQYVKQINGLRLYAH